MDTSLFALKKLKYRLLPSLIGQKVIISCLDRVESDVLCLVGTFAAFRLKNSTTTMAVQMAKYGFLDLDFTTSQPLLSAADNITSKTLRELGYGPRPKDTLDTDPDLKNELGSDRVWLEALIESVAQHDCFLRLFLSFESPRDSVARIFEELKQWRPEEISDMDAASWAISAIAAKMAKRFPITFVVEDACVTNSSSIWLAKHQYL